MANKEQKIILTVQTFVFVDLVQLETAELQMEILFEFQMVLHLLIHVVPKRICSVRVWIKAFWTTVVVFLFYKEVDQCLLMYVQDSEPW